MHQKLLKPLTGFDVFYGSDYIRYRNCEFLLPFKNVVVGDETNIIFVYPSGMLEWLNDDFEKTGNCYLYPEDYVNGLIKEVKELNMIIHDLKEQLDGR